MNRYIRNIFCLSVGVGKVLFTKMWHLNGFSASPICVLSPSSEITLERTGTLKLGSVVKMRDGAKIRVRKRAMCILEDNVSLGTGTIITCRDHIEIGSGTQLGPNVMIYDHDHDFRDKNGIGAMHYRTSPIVIGKNVWVGANTVILRGTSIGDNAVIGAGCVIKGNIPANTVAVQKRETRISGGVCNNIRDINSV